MWFGLMLNVPLNNFSVMFPCDTPFTIKHILLHCVDFQNSCDEYYKVNTLKELFKTIEIHNIFRLSERN